jgi:hypothetical protein
MAPAEKTPVKIGAAVVIKAMMNGSDIKTGRFPWSEAPIEDRKYGYGAAEQHGRQPYERASFFQP